MKTLPGQPSHEARLLGCTCTWLRGFGVGPVAWEWFEMITYRDPECPVDHEDVVELAQDLMINEEDS